MTHNETTLRDTCYNFAMAHDFEFYVVRKSSWFELAFKDAVRETRLNLRLERDFDGKDFTAHLEVEWAKGAKMVIV